MKLHLLHGLAFCLFTCALPAQSHDLRITVPDGPKPWTGLDIEAPDDQFQFAIVTDRTSGMRPGVFSEAVHKLNLLRPPFVMSVGDLINGYTRDLPKLRRQWEEFDDLQPPHTIDNVFCLQVVAAYEKVPSDRVTDSLNQLYTVKIVPQPARPAQSRCGVWP